MTSRVVVLGATGFIGGHVAAALRASGSATPVLVWRRTPPKALEGIEAVRADVTDAAALAHALAGASGVVNCVTGDGATIVRGAATLFEVAAKLKPRPRIVHFSSLAAYGSVTGEVDESVPLLGDLGPYSTAKRESEALAAAYANVVTLRPGIVYGPGSLIWSARIGEWLLARRLGDLGAIGEGFCNLVAVADVATAVLRALERENAAGEAFNLASPAPPTWNEYFKFYAEALGAPPLRRLSGARLWSEMHLLAPPLKLAELASRALHRAPPPAPIRPWLPALTRQKIRLRVERAERTLEMRWTPLRQGLADAAHWYLRSRHPAPPRATAAPGEHP